MIVPKPMLRLILTGQKTTVRIPAKASQPAPYKPGQSVPVRKHHKGPADCRIVIVDKPALEPLSAITYDQVRQEGYSTSEEFKRGWVEQHDRQWVRKQQADLERFGIPADEADAALDELKLARFDQVHANRHAWVFHIRLDKEERDRYLAAQSDELYVSSPWRALDGDAPAVSPAELDRQVDEARKRWNDNAKTRKAEREQLSLDKRLAQAAKLAKERRRDVSSRLRLIESQVAAIERDVHGDHEQKAA